MLKSRAAYDQSVQTTTCAICHGDLGKGDGVGAGMDEPRPYDFTRPEFAGMRAPPGTAVLYAILTRGIDGTRMAQHKVLKHICLGSPI